MARRGRPAREPTPEERTKVRDLAASGAPRTAIAKALDRSLPNLRKFFAAELAGENNSPPAAAHADITSEMREDVALMAACNEPHADIAEALGISEAELAAHFADELGRGVARYRLKILRQMDKAAATGNISATRQLAQRLAPTPAPEAAAKSPALGKKAAAKAEAEAAVTAGSKFAPRAAPRLATVNGRPADTA